MDRSTSAYSHSYHFDSKFLCFFSSKLSFFLSFSEKLAQKPSDGDYGHTKTGKKFFFRFLSIFVRLQAKIEQYPLLVGLSEWEFFLWVFRL